MFIIVYRGMITHTSINKILIEQIQMHIDYLIYVTSLDAEPMILIPSAIVKYIT